jgi:MtfA peptidase
MESLITAIVFVLLLVVLIAAFFANFIGIFYDLINHFFREDINRYLLIKPLRKKHKKILEDYFAYYRELPRREKRLFEKRVRKFMDLKEFIPRGGLSDVSDIMKTLISATAIQLTFGLPGVYFRHFKKILIYPDDYYSRIYKRYHRGEVNPGLGVIILSWKYFLEGYIQKKNGLNLGLHEMAHALHLENRIFNQEYRFLDEEALSRFNILMEEELNNTGENGFFRKYAQFNAYEFFAVAVEQFFERPEEFYNYNPEMYNLMTRMLNQNPLKKVNFVT